MLFCKLCLCPTKYTELMISETLYVYLSWKKTSKPLLLFHVLQTCFKCGDVNINKSSKISQVSNININFWKCFLRCLDSLCNVNGTCILYHNIYREGMFVCVFFFILYILKIGILNQLIYTCRNMSLSKDYVVRTEF